MDISAAGYVYTEPLMAANPTPANGHGSFAVPQTEPADNIDKSANGLELDPEESKQVEKLKARDREVRAHEMAHLAAAGGLAMSGASFTYQRGPDGVSYAIGGEVQIDTSSGSTPEETLRKAQIIRAAALAPAEPSGQDRAVAAKAAQMEARARVEQASAESEQQAGGQSTATQQYLGVASGFAAAPGLSLQA